MTTRTIKTADLTGAALAYCVSRIEHPDWEEEGHRVNVVYPDDDGWVFRPDIDPGQGGPIIEREGINTFRHNKLDPAAAWVWCGHKVVPRPNMEGTTNMVAIAPDGPTMLVAAMRCYVASKLGDTVEVPEELQ
jgi:hypothetical protein